MAVRVVLASCGLALTGGLSLEASLKLGANATADVFSAVGVDAAFQEAASTGCLRNPIGFDAFVQKFGKAYRPDSAEYEMRSRLFRERQEAVRLHNCAAVRLDGPIWTASINHLSDWTHTELMRLRGHKSHRVTNAGSVSRFPTFLASRGSTAREFPSEFSWGNLSAIRAPSEDQGDCGSCWAMAAGMVMRSRAEIKGLPHQFSTEQMIACTLNPHNCGGTGGCDGATAELAYEYVLRSGLVSPEQYSELSQQASRTHASAMSQCPGKLSVSTEIATNAVMGMDGSEVHQLGTSEAGLKGMAIGMRGWTKLPENKEEPIMRSLMMDGPLYVAVAVSDHWHYYEKGVMTQEGCDPHNVINHAVTLFAWGVKEKTRIGPVKYWNIKNSWGPHWGEEGHVRLHRMDDEEKRCGWDINPQQGNGCDGGPKQVWVCGACGILYDAVAPHF